ncbi:MAG: hypothetical protein KF909_12730, partial [Rhodocyclaceae bacterium]|nr:hypothetical protein [Rhodocyclaceae bacterium]
MKLLEAGTRRSSDSCLADAGVVGELVVLEILGQAPIVFHRIFVDIMGSVTAALWLSYALYALAKHPERESWFWHTARDWLESTGLSRREQESARRVLVGRNLVLQQRAGMPARLHFKVNLDELGRGLTVHLGEPESAWQWDDARLRRLLGRPVAFFRPLATVSGSVAAGLYLSHLCMAMRAMAMRGERCAAASQDGWMDLPIQASAQRLCLGAKSLRNARSRLVSGGLVEVRWARGMPPRKLTRIAHRRLAHRLSLLKSGRPDASTRPQAPGDAGLAESANPRMTIAPNRNGAIRSFNLLAPRWACTHKVGFAPKRDAQPRHEAWRRRSGRPGKTSGVWIDCRRKTLRARQPATIRRPGASRGPVFLILAASILACLRLAVIGRDSPQRARRRFKRLGNRSVQAWVTVLPCLPPGRPVRTRSASPRSVTPGPAMKQGSVDRGARARPQARGSTASTSATALPVACMSSSARPSGSCSQLGPWGSSLTPQ